jgi:hypothetical protein
VVRAGGASALASGWVVVLNGGGGIQTSSIDPTQRGHSRCLRCFTQEVFCQTVLNGKKEQTERRKRGKTRNLRYFAHEVFCHTVLNGKTEQTERRKRGKTIKAPAVFCTGGFLSDCVKWKKRTDGKTDGNVERQSRLSLGMKLINKSSLVD